MIEQQKELIANTNLKVTGLKPIWAPFKGISLLFDNPGHSLAPLEQTEHAASLLKMNCLYNDPELLFYSKLWDQNQFYSHLTYTYLFCPLPLHSYHVTVWDGLNDFNVCKVAEPHREDAEKFLDNLPGSLIKDSKFCWKASGEPIAIHMKKIEFVFDKVEKWSQSVVVRLKPANYESEVELQKIEVQRLALIRDYNQRFQIKTTTEQYRPHVSIGYFLNQSLGDESVPAIQALNEKLKQETKGLKLSFSGISLYGMTDMETFFKRLK